MAQKKYRYISATENFKKTPPRNPTRAPRAAFKAFFRLLSCKSSPVYAPKKGPAIIPNGPKNSKPITSPMDAP